MQNIGEFLGAHMIGLSVTEMIAEVLLPAEAPKPQVGRNQQFIRIQQWRWGCERSYRCHGETIDVKFLFCL